MDVKFLVLSKDQIREIFESKPNDSKDSFFQRLIGAGNAVLEESEASQNASERASYEAPKAHVHPPLSDEEIEHERHLRRLIEYIEILKSSSKSLKRQVACVITDENCDEIVSIGVNDSVVPNNKNLEGFDFNQPGRFKTFGHVLHAEEMALSTLPLTPHQTYNMFITCPPCLHCAAQILNAARSRESEIRVFVLGEINKSDMLKFSSPDWYQDGITPEQIFLNNKINQGLISIEFLD